MAMVCPSCAVELAPEVIGATESVRVGPFRDGAPYDLLDPRMREIDRCLQCGGIWFDAGELVVGLREIAGEVAAQPTKRLRALAAITGPVLLQGQPTCSCPRCEALMQTLRCGAAPAVVYARCPGCQGVWFGSGQLRQLAEPLPSALALILREFD